MSSSRDSGDLARLHGRLQPAPKLSGTGAGKPKIVSPPGISRSRPALADWTVLWLPNQSETTKPSEAPVALQDVGQQVRVLARVVAVDLVVGAHQRPHAAVLDGLLELRGVDLAQRPLGTTR